MGGTYHLTSHGLPLEQEVLGLGLAREPRQGLGLAPEPGLAREPRQGLGLAPGQGLARGPEPGLALAPEQGLARGPGQGLGFGQGWSGERVSPGGWTHPSSGLVSSDLDPNPPVCRINPSSPSRDDDRYRRKTGLGLGLGTETGLGLDVGSRSRAGSIPPPPPSNKQPGGASKSIRGLVTLHLPSGATFHAFPSTSSGQGLGLGQGQGQGLAPGQGPGQGPRMVMGKVCSVLHSYSTILNSPYTKLALTQP